MSIDITECASNTIDAIAAKLDPDLIKRKFDEPIDRVVRQFKCETTYPVGHKTFHRLIAKFVQEIYESGLQASWLLTDPLTEAISILDRYYQSAVYNTGYIAALLDANDAAEGGMQTVLTSLAESIKDIERQKYIAAVLTWHLRRISWPLQCEIARILLEDCRAFLPERLAGCVPAQIVDEIPSLVHIFIHSDAALQQIAFSNDESPSAETLLNRNPL
jgi:hypothetical protein